VVFIKKVSIILLTISICIASLLVLPVQQASALSVPNIGQATKIIRAIGEKMGIKWTKPALDVAVSYIAGAIDRDDGHSPIVPHWWFFGTTPDTIPLDDGFERMTLSPDDFKNGLGLLKEASDTVKVDDSRPIYATCNPEFPLADSTLLDSSNKKFYSYMVSGVKRINIYDSTTVVITKTGTNYYASSGLGHSWVFKEVNGAYVFIQESIDNTTDSRLILDSSFEPVVQGLTADGFCKYNVITPDEIMNISNTTTVTIFNNITNNYVINNNYFPTIDVPVSDTGDDTDIDTPWNPPMEPDDVFVPPVVDTDNDGIPDGTDITPGGETPTPDDTGIFAKLFPVLLIVKLFGVLGSCLMYLVRMFQFIMTIPGIDAIPIDNDAFVWFRSAQIVGIKIYDVVSSLAGVGLSFIVFRAIRRAYL
jgi:hypothetical protein